MSHIQPFTATRGGLSGRRYLLAVLFAFAAVSLGCSSGDDPTAPTASIGGGETAEDSLPAEASNQANTGGSPTTQTPATDVDPLHPEVLLKTSLGEIKLRLDRENAPVTVNNFLNYADSGHYDGTLFHQAIKDFIVLGGGYNEQHEEKPTNFPIRNEADNGQKNVRGTIAMARQPDVIASSTSQFFFNVADNESLDHSSKDADGYGYCVFGKVIEGMDVVDKIAQSSVTDRENFDSTPATPIVIQSVTRAR